MSDGESFDVFCQFNPRTRSAIVHVLEKNTRRYFVSPEDALPRPPEAGHWRGASLGQGAVSETHLRAHLYWCSAGQCPGWEPFTLTRCFRWAEMNGCRDQRPQAPLASDENSALRTAGDKLCGGGQLCQSVMPRSSRQPPGALRRPGKASTHPRAQTVCMVCARAFGITC